MKTPKEIANLAQMACILEVCAFKPGNVSLDRSFSDTSALDFLRSAMAVGKAFEEAAHFSVGQIIYQAVKDTHASVPSNTNLGIVLLLAPLVKACQGEGNHESIRASLREILNGLSVEDAQLAYEAIRLARPGGMGSVPESDISSEPSITLLQAMALAQDRDSVAREYAGNFAITFELAFPTLKDAISRGAAWPRAIVQSYLTILSQVPDTLVARKNGREVAEKISLQARDVLQRGGIFTAEGRNAVEAMDADLRDPAHRLNPGTTADLTTAGIFLLLLEFVI